MSRELLFEKFRKSACTELAECAEEHEFLGENGNANRKKICIYSCLFRNAETHEILGKKSRNAEIPSQKAAIYI